MELDSGKILNNRYKVVNKLGKGSEGHVFLVEDTSENLKK